MKKLDEGSKTDNILIVAAEASSCMYAKRFIDSWKSHKPETHFFGIGDKEMQASGVECLGLAEDLAVVGLQEVINHWPQIKECFNGILKRAEELKPRYALLLDYPGFNLRLAKKLKTMGIPVVYYISPQLWAWKKGRVKQVRQYVDDMKVVFPFEVDFYKEHGIEAQFVGHPLVEVVDQERQALQVRPPIDKPVLGLMPGSRNSELKYNFQVQLQTALALKKKNDIVVRVLVAPTLEIDQLKELAGPLASEVEFEKAPPTEMITGCDLLLSASGTATLQVALCEKPMVVMYRMNPITAFLAKILVRSVDAFCIVNLISKKKIVPEFFQGDANPKTLACALEPLLDKKSDQYQQMLSDINEVKGLLGAGGATENLTRSLLEKYN